MFNRSSSPFLRPTDPSSLSRPPGLSGSMMAGRYSVGVLLEQVDRGELPFPLHSQAKSPFHRVSILANITSL